MSTTNVTPPFPLFTDDDGAPLDAGVIYIGTANANPISNPIAVFWDSALTISAAQPIRTVGGYPSRNGAPGTLFVASDYSITVQDKNGVQQLTNPSGGRAGLGSIVLAATESLTAESGSSIVLEDGSTMTVGDATGTGVTVTFGGNARVIGNVLPNVTGTQALGSTARRWDVFADAVDTTSVAAADVSFTRAAQPVTTAELVTLNRRTLVLAAARQTSVAATPTAATTNIYNVGTILHPSLGVYDIPIGVDVTALADVTFCVVPDGQGIIANTTLSSSSASSIRVNFYSAPGAVAVDCAFSFTLIGYIPV